MLLRPLERVSILMVFAMIAINTMLAFSRGVSVAQPLIIAAMIIAAMALITGLFFRTLKKDETLSLLFLNTGILFLFSFSSVLYSHLLLPFGRPTIDATLVEIDAMIGFHWPAIMTWAAQYPIVSTVTRMPMRHRHGWYLRPLSLLHYTGTTHGFTVSCWPFSSRPSQQYQFGPCCRRRALRPIGHCPMTSSNRSIRWLAPNTASNC